MCAAEKLQLNRQADELTLVEVKSNGERVVFKDNDCSIPTILSLNGRIFVSVKDHLDALTPLPEQEMVTDGIDIDVELLSTKELAYYMTMFDWDLFWAINTDELLYFTFGRHHFNKVLCDLITINLLGFELIVSMPVTCALKYDNCCFVQLFFFILTDYLKSRCFYSAF